MHEPPIKLWSYIFIDVFVYICIFFYFTAFLGHQEKLAVNVLLCRRVGNVSCFQQEKPLGMGMSLLCTLVVENVVYFHQEKLSVTGLLDTLVGND